MTEPLIPLARAVAATVQRLELADVEVAVDRQAGTVVAQGAGMANWGQRQRLEHALDQARLNYETQPGPGPARDPPSRRGRLRVSPDGTGPVSPKRTPG